MPCTRSAISSTACICCCTLRLKPSTSTSWSCRWRSSRHILRNWLTPGWRSKRSMQFWIFSSFRLSFVSTKLSRTSCSSVLPMRVTCSLRTRSTFTMASGSFLSSSQTATNSCLSTTSCNMLHWLRSSWTSTPRSSWWANAMGKGSSAWPARSPPGAPDTTICEEDAHADAAATAAAVASAAAFAATASRLCSAANSSACPSTRRRNAWSSSRATSSCCRNSLASPAVCSSNRTRASWPWRTVSTWTRRSSSSFRVTSSSSSRIWAMARLQFILKSSISVCVAVLPSGNDHDETDAVCTESCSRSSAIAFPWSRKRLPACTRPSPGTTNSDSNNSATCFLGLARASNRSTLCRNCSRVLWVSSILLESALMRSSSSPVGLSIPDTPRCWTSMSSRWRKMSMATACASMLLMARVNRSCTLSLPPSICSCNFAWICSISCACAPVALRQTSNT
mmetsp:Transcript_61622/g.172171  ORF Transcript_61622/g.172171 Transcript_61622/m.172171 type:complete len:452 (+) Transcript_61622:286-1641(+)